MPAQDPQVSSPTARWRANAKRLADRVAVHQLCTDEAWTWAQLIAQVDKRRRLLQRYQVGPGMRLALLDDASPSWIAWVWACFEEGVVWCPLPGSDANARRDRQISHCDPHAIVEGGILRLHSPRAPLCPEGSAYLIYTSGSTGNPKGVLVGTSGLESLWQEQAMLFGTTKKSRAAWMLSPAFDASVSDVGVALYAGATLFIVPKGRWLRWNAWVADMDKHGITQVDAPPSWLGLWHAKDPPASLQTIIAGGEPTPLPILRAWADRVRWVNVYGPTEATVCTSAHVRRAQDADLDQASIGTPFSHTHYAIDPVDPDEPGFGELWIGGPAVALGYWNDEALTQARFVDIDGLRWFKSGDLVRRDGDAWIWVGRLDRQIKRRGKLINLDEIEQQVSACPGVSHACALVDANERLWLVVPIDAPSNDALAQWCQDRLPAWGQPQRIARLDGMPLTHTGKIDRRDVRAQLGLDPALPGAVA